MAHPGDVKAGGLAREVAAVAGEEAVVKRPARRVLTGIAFNMQKTHLVLDEAGADGVVRHRCQMTDSSDGGFCVTLRVPGGLGTLFWVGMRLNLEALDGKPVRVEVRWLTASRMGLRRLLAGEDFSQVARPAGGAGADAACREAVLDGLIPRGPRRVVTQKCRLILDRPDAMGVKAHAGRVLNSAAAGFCVAIDVSYPLPELCEGARLDLEQMTGRRVRYEVRWFKGGRVGLREVKAGGG